MTHLNSPIITQSTTIFGIFSPESKINKKNERTLSSWISFCCSSTWLLMRCLSCLSLICRFSDSSGLVIACASPSRWYRLLFSPFMLDRIEMRRVFSLIFFDNSSFRLISCWSIECSLRASLSSFAWTVSRASSTARETVIVPRESMSTYVISIITDRVVRL